MKKLAAAVVLLAGTLLSGCAGSGTTPAPARMSVQESCSFLNGDNFVPSGTQKERAGQIAQHYQEVADKVAPEVAAPIQKMADVMKEVAATADGTQTAEQTAQFREQINKIGEYCK
ncbi:hypothetical protein QFZ79_000469 [Arthrobacter sp. V4I6]|uniref:hypothetical protein n=1 Tax=unclassified Arthrobacter TaxID=235627 RepID=UPI0027863E67|nr:MULTISPECIES: hypothetical protein [unclassified Arthrobacter]MDQ0822730.1 outer membrane murein-binding lipoprotein Lpp [Arthrobacter sp. V1I7]MDQ0852358.1 hypothetical protein [Arthrobacter sp. V4I6]